MDFLAKKYIPNLVRNLVSAADQEKVEQGVTHIEEAFDWVMKEGKPIESWQHVGGVEGIMSKAGLLAFSRRELRQSAADYLDHLNWLHCKQFDWFYANILAFAELSAFLLTLRPIMHFQPGAPRVWALAIKLAWSLVKWVAWACILFIAFQSDTSFLGASLVLLTLLVQGRKLIRARKSHKLVASMISVYDALNSMTLSWSVIWDLMTKSRDLGAVWDPELYKLVESRMRQ